MKMKTCTLPVVLALAALGTAGCNQQSNGNSGTTNSTSLMDTNYPGTNSVSTNSMSTNVVTTATNAWQNSQESGSNAWTSTKNAASNVWETTKEDSSNLWQQARQALGGTNEVSTNYFAYDYSMKDSFLSKAGASVNYLDQQTDNFSNRVTISSISTSTNNPDLQQQWQTVNRQRDQLHNNLEQVKNATQDNWDEAKAAFIKSYVDLKAALKAGKDNLTADL